MIRKKHPEKKSFWKEVREKLNREPSNNEFAVTRQINYMWASVTLFAFLFLVLAYLLSIPLETEIDMDCSSGKIGLDLVAFNKIQAYPCRTMDYSDLTCFKEDMFIDHFNIDGVDNLNCNIKIKGKLPAAFFLGGGLN